MKDILIFVECYTLITLLIMQNWTCKCCALLLVAAGCWLFPQEVPAQAAVIPSLQEAYKGDFLLGVAVSMNHLETPAEAAMIKKHFGCLTAENYMKPASILRRDGTYNYVQADRIVSFAKENNLKMRGHTLVWHSQTPPWFFTGDGDAPLD